MGAAAEVRALDLLVLPQLGGRAVEDDAAALDDVAVVGEVERHPCVLLDEEHGRPELALDLAQALEDQLDRKGREAE